MLKAWKVAPLAEQIPIYALLLMLTSLFSIFSGAYILLKKNSTVAQTGALFTLLSAAWSIAYSLEISSLDLNTKVFWFSLKIISTVITPMLFINFVVHFFQIDSIKPAMRYMFTLPLILSVLLILTNNSHHIMWGAVYLNPEQVYNELVVNYHIGTWFAVGYNYALLFFAAAHILSILQKYRRLYWQRVTSLVLCVVIPWAINMFYMAGTKLFGFDMTPMLINLASIILIFVTPDILYRRDILHVARELIVDGIKDAVLVLDPDNMILDANFAARQMLRLPGLGALNTSIDPILPQLAEQVDLNSLGGSPPI